MRSKVHPKYKTKYRVGNWSAYEQALVQRGDVTLWLSADATDVWRPSPSGRPGAPKTFSDCAIETALTLRLVFRLPLRQAEGFLRSVLSSIGVDLAAPDHTTLSRRSQSLAVAFRRIPSRGPIHLIVDSTGLSIVGEGEWAAVKHGGRGHRGWKTRHLAVDRVGVIVAHALTEPTVDDATIGIDLIETVDDEIARVTADAAYDTVAFYEAAEMRDATVVVPPSKTARVSRRRPRSCARDRTITDVRTLGRRRWKKEAGYQLQARVENAFFRYKSIIGDRLRARSRGGRVAESVVACNVLNQMTELGRPESYSIQREPEAPATLRRRVLLPLQPARGRARPPIRTHHRQRIRGGRMSIPKATHTGELQIGPVTIECAVLDNGARVLEQAAFLRALDRSSRPQGKGARFEQIAPFLASDNLKPFITKELAASSRRIRFAVPGRVHVYGYEAELLPKACDVYLQARDASVLLPDAPPI